MERAKKIVDDTQPHCELCAGTLQGGCLTTVVRGGQPIIVCFKCINVSVAYYVHERDKRLGIDAK